MDNKTNKPDEITEVIPTLYIALGGTGAEILWRIRRRILNNLWGLNTGSPVRLESLNQFPFAEFLQIDLDANTVTESGKAQNSDILSGKVAFKEEERIVKKLDMSKYIKTDGELAKYPNIENWFPLNRAKINELNIDPEKGAGQIRSISRLYFFDKYQEIKSAIKTKADRLMSNVSSESAQKKLGLKTRTGTLNIVVVASTAGGTGSGSFLDLGYLSNIIGKQAATIGGATCNLALLLPTGYKGANLERTQANTYAALMELETCMRQGSNYISRWSDSDIIRDMPENPYKDVYLIDTCNVSGAQTEDIKDIYDMVADAMFEDFSTAEFANKKRSISVNQNQHKIIPYTSRVDKAKYGDMKLTYSRSFSSFGQATIDTHLEQKQNIIIYKQVNDMLKAFFGITSNEAKSNLPTEQERDELISNRLQLGFDNDVIEYDFLNKSDEYFNGVERTTYPLVSELLRVNGVSRLDDIEKSISDTFEEIRVGGSFNDWEDKIADAIDKINHDTFKGVESGSGLFEDGIRKRRDELLQDLMNSSKEDGLIKAFWDRVDNKERGGLDYTIDLIQRIKDRIDNGNTGLLKVLNENAKWYSDLSGFVRNEDLTKLQTHLREAISMANGFFGKKELPASTLKHLSEAVRVYVRYHLYSLASKETAILIRDVSDQLGKKIGVDSNGNPVWDGFIGKLEAGRSLVKDIISDSENQINRTNEALKQSHAMYFVLPAPKSNIDSLKLVTTDRARDWAESVFKDFGGTEKLFEMLADEDGRSELLSKLRNRALSLIAEAPTESEVNPLFIALEQHQDRLDLFGKFLQRAVPWVGSTLDRYLKEQTPEDQYKCYVGVKNHKQFEAKFGAEFKSKIPTNAFMTANQIAFVEIDQPGKLVCYTELSGIPIASLKALDDWYGSYRVESAKIPVHTHKRTSTFVHPRELTLNELASISMDFRLFIEAVALGVLTRVSSGDDIGIYQLSVKGSKRNVGDERLLRLNGFDASYQKIIKQQVDSDLELLKTADQLATWCALMEYYKDNVYPIKVVKDDSVDREVESLPTLIANQLIAEYSGRLGRLIGSSQEATRLIDKARSSILDWSEEIHASEADIYQYEVNVNNLSPKRVLRSEVLKAEWKFASTGTSSAQATVGIMPPPLNADIQYFIAINSQQVGPLGINDLIRYVQSGNLTKETLVWKNGMSGWLPSYTVPEIASLFAAGIASPPPLPPPLA